MPLLGLFALFVLLLAGAAPSQEVIRGRCVGVPDSYTIRILRAKQDFPLITRRIAAQRSRFIVFGTKPNWLSEEAGKPDSTIASITVAADARSSIRQELRDCGVTKSVIYPDLDGLGREIRQLWEDRRAAAEENV